jgi:putative addiction module killer protein
MAIVRRPANAFAMFCRRSAKRVCIRLDTINGMNIVKRHPAFIAWIDSLKDMDSRRRLLMRLRKAELGNLGDVKPVGEGVWEMREFFGPGWRMYYVWRGQALVLVLMLGGGSKSTQTKDIEAAKALASGIE